MNGHALRNCKMMFYKSNMDNPLIALSGIVKNLNSQRILNNVNLLVAQGEFFSILGPSGCGKTTLLKIMAGLIKQDAGRIAIAGVDHSATPPHERPVNLVFQHYALFPHLNVWENTAFGLRMRRLAEKEIRARVAEALAMIELEDKAHRLPEELSGGERQRVALARALINRPKVLLLDEPLSNLDMHMREKLREKLRRLNAKTGITFLMVTHDQGEALSLSSRIAVMRAGEILQIGPAREIYESPANTFVAHFVGTSNVLTGVLAEHGTSAGGPARLKIAANGASSACAWARPAFAEIESWPLGLPVALAIRPELLHITSTPAETFDNTLFGRVDEVNFLGFEIFYKVKVQWAREQCLLVRKLHSPMVKIRERGERVVVQWREQDATLLKNAPSETAPVAA